MNTDWLRKFCLSLPAATEDVKWGHDLCFSVGGKMFCVTSLEPPLKVAFKVPDDVFEEISSQNGFVPAPYMARARWVLVTDSSKLGKKEWESYIRGSYALIKSKLSGKLRQQLGIDK